LIRNKGSERSRSRRADATSKKKKRRRGAGSRRHLTGWSPERKMELREKIEKDIALRVKGLPPQKANLEVGKGKRRETKTTARPQREGKASRNSDVHARILGERERWHVRNSG